MPGMDGTGPSGTGLIGGRRGRCRPAETNSSVERDSPLLKGQVPDETGKSRLASYRGTSPIGYGRRVRGRIMRRNSNGGE